VVVPLQRFLISNFDHHILSIDMLSYSRAMVQVLELLWMLEMLETAMGVLKNLRKLLIRAVALLR